MTHARPAPLYRLAAILVALVALGSSLPGASAGPAAYVERNFSVAGSLSLAGTGSFGALVGVELPVGLPLPVDFSVSLEAGYQQGSPTTRVLAKLLLLPSVGGDPPLAVALGIEKTALYTADGVLLRLGAGPILSVDLSPIVLSGNIFPSFGSGGLGVDVGASARYYLDPVVFELAGDFSSATGSATISLGLRYLF